MDLEFDKEMDALLRKAAGRGVLVGDDAKSHLDADTIAAFAENALPQKSRTIYTQHLAACDPCRMSLANLISINAAAEPAMAAAAAPVPLVSVPWYRKLFQAPNLAYVMGGLVLIFGGLLGVYVLQNSSLRQEVAMTALDKNEQSSSAPARTEAANAVSNTTASNTNSSSNAAGEIPHSLGVADQTSPESYAVPAMPPAAFSAAPSPAIDVVAAKPEVVSSDKDTAAGRTIAPAAAPVKEEPKREDDEQAKAKNEVRVAGEKELRKQDANASNLYNNQQNSTQMMPGADNKSGGPNRAVQRDNRDLSARQVQDLPMNARSMEGVTAATESKTATSRKVSGKTFELKQGAWYDTAFQGQATKNVQRGTDEFRKLDSGLRNIANSISGTVVVVWKGKAYRIQ